MCGNERIKKAASLLLAMLMVLQYIPAPVLAEEMPQTGLCEHHPAHENCGYIAAVAGVACNHNHDDSCYRIECVHTHGECGYVAAIEGMACDHVHDDLCGYSEPVAEVTCICQQEVHTEECVYAPAIPEGKCSHIHGECSFVEARDEIPCGHDCAKDEVCSVRVLVCTHLHDDHCGYVEAVVGQNCGFACEECAAAEASAAAVAEVKALVDALPVLDVVQTMGVEDQKVAYNQTQAAYEAYGRLTEEQQQELADQMVIFEQLFTYFNKQTADASSDIGSGVFGENLHWVLDGDGVLTISGEGAIPDFGNSNAPWKVYSDSITSLIIQNGITRIGNSAFYGCSKMKSATIPDSVTAIGNSAFGYCSLTSVSMGSGITEIGSGAFTSNDFSGITLPETVRSIGASAFDSCMNLTAIAIPNGVTAIENFVFHDCIKLSSVNLPSSVTKIGTYAFGECLALASIALPKNITTIESSAFSNCEKLSSITLPESITTIGDHAFSYCPLSSVTIPAGVSSLGEAVFYHCMNLSEILVVESNLYYSSKDGVLFNKAGTSLLQCPSGKSGSYAIPNGTVILEDNAFCHCSNLTGIAIPETVTTIGQYAFYDCSRVTTLEIPSGVTSIDTHTFYQCSGLTNVVLPSGIPTIGSKTFEGCSSLRSITIPNSVTYIGESAFEDCASLTSIVIPEGITCIYSGTFGGCTKLQTVTIPKSVNQIVFQAFIKCNALTDIYFGGTQAQWDAMNIADWGNDPVFNATVHCASDSTDEGVAEGNFAENLHWTLDAEGTLTVSGTGDMPSFEYYSSTPWYGYRNAIETVIVENGVTSIGQHAFENCNNLTAVNVGSDITKIEAYAFDWCEVLSSITFTGNAPQMADRTFYSVNATAYYPGDNTTWTSEIKRNYGGSLYWRPIGETGNPKGICGENLTWELYENGTLEISGTGAMYDFETAEAPWAGVAPKIKNVVINDGATNVGSNAFYRCGALSNVEISNTVTSIGNMAFLATALTSVSIPDSVQRIGEYAFDGCPLTSLVIPDSVTSIGMAAFAYCEELRSVTLPQKITQIEGYTFEKCDSLTSVDIPDSVTIIGDHAFAYCYNLGSVTMHEGIISIGGYAFARCRPLTSITIPSSVISIGDHAFEECFSSETVYFRGNAPTFSDTAFYANRATAYYPAHNPTWTESVMKGYGGTITWKPLTCEEHTVVIDEAKEATCKENGLTEGSHCYICGLILVEQKVTEKKLHTYDNACDADCNVCGAGRTPSEHSYDDIYDTDCNECGAERPPRRGTCGDNLFWDLDINGKLSITGEGPMYDYSLDNPAPWVPYRDEIKVLDIAQGTATIGSYAFYGCAGLTSVEIPDSVVSIGEYAFGNCSNLKDVEIPDSVEKVPGSAWVGSSVGSVVIGGNKPIDSMEGYEGIEEIWFRGDFPGIGKNAFWNIVATAYYPACNATWTADKLQDYGGDITWVPYGPDHVYDNACDVDCNKCGAERTPTDHIYDNACDADCNVCGAKRTPANHVYDNACDVDCNVCGAKRTPAAHVYDNACDADCNVCGHERVPSEHEYSKICDETCNVCGHEREAKDHVYTNACDTICNRCKEETRTAVHSYSNNCDTSCNVCGATRAIRHVYDDQYDATCNVCGAQRTVSQRPQDTVTDTGTTTRPNGNTNTQKPALNWESKDESKQDGDRIQADSVEDAANQAGQKGEVIVSPGNQNNSESVSQIELPKDALETVVKKEVSLTIELTEAHVTLDEKALEAVAGQANGQTVSLEFTEIKEAKLNNAQKKVIQDELDNKIGQKHVFTFSCALTSDNQEIHDFHGGIATVRIPFVIQPGTRGEDHAVFYLSPDGSIERVEAVYEDGYLVVKLTHFSEYVVFHMPEEVTMETAEAIGAADLEVDEEKNVTDETAPLQIMKAAKADRVNRILMIIVALCVAGIVVVGVILYVILKKEKQLK